MSCCKHLSVLVRTYILNNPGGFLLNDNFEAWFLEPDAYYPLSL